MYVKPMCSLINTVLQMIRHLACSCLFAREHNISGDEKSSDHAKPRQNRGVQFSYKHKHQSLQASIATWSDWKNISWQTTFPPILQSHTNEEQSLFVIGAKAYAVLSDLCSPTPRYEKSYAQLTTILKNHFVPKSPKDTDSTIVHNAKARVSQRSLLT